MIILATSGQRSDNTWTKILNYPDKLTSNFIPLRMYVIHSKEVLEMRCLETMKITEILRLYNLNFNYRDIATSVGCSVTPNIHTLRFMPTVSILITHKSDLSLPLQPLSEHS